MLLHTYSRTCRNTQLSIPFFLSASMDAIFVKEFGRNLANLLSRQLLNAGQIKLKVLYATNRFQNDQINSIGKSLGCANGKNSIIIENVSISKLSAIF